jgi:hypothetical protein
MRYGRKAASLGGEESVDHKKEDEYCTECSRYLLEPKKFMHENLISAHLVEEEKAVCATVVSSNPQKIRDSLLVS